MSRLSMRKISEVFRQKFELKRSNREIARSLNISSSTVFDYLNRAKAAKLSWPLPQALTEQSLYDVLFLPAKAKGKNKLHPDWEYMHRELHKKGMTLQLLWREYRENNLEG